MGIDRSRDAISKARSQTVAAAALATICTQPAAFAQSFTPAEGDPLIPYASIADSPFFGDGVACHALETFPDGAQGTAGWSFTPGATIAQDPLGNWVLQQNTIGVITLNFAPDDDGNYPTRVGFVWTGGDPKYSSQIRLDVISGGTQSASRTFTKLPPNPSDDPDSNLFFGVGWSTGLQQVRITFNPFFGVANQIDDIQFSVETNVVGISSAETELNQAGGKGSFSVSSIATACTWTPTADVPWITDLTASGSGDGKVLFTVEPNPEPFVRTGTITVGEFTHTVTQSPADCVVTGLTPDSAEFTAAGGDASFTVSTSGPECSWIATTTDDWITIGQSTGTGKAEMVTYTVAENTGIMQRTGSITVKKQTFTVTQAGAECAVTGIEPTEAAFEAAGGSETFAVTMNGATCPWSAVLEEGVDWIVLDVASGTGDGAVEYTVAENTASDGRIGTIAVGDQTFTVTQAAPCAIVAIDPTGATPDTAGGAASFAVDMNGETCPWTAVLEEGVDWITLDVDSGTGDGEVAYTVAENTASDERTGTITVEGLEFIVTQDGTGCVVTSLEPVAASVEAAAGTGTFDVFVSGETCEWTAVSNDLWITIAAESGSGTGNGTVEYAFEANTDPIERTGTITVEGLAFTVTQDAGCDDPDADADGDGTPDCLDDCPDDPLKTEPGLCGCGIADTDLDGDGEIDCLDPCVGEVSLQSEALAPFGTGLPLVVLFEDLPDAEGEVRIGLEVRADLDGFSEFLTVAVDGEDLDVLFNVDGLACPDTPQVAEVVLSAAAFNDANLDGVVEFRVQPSNFISIEECPESFVRLGLTYDLASEDCDANGEKDACDILDGVVGDCNANGVPDSCDVADGVLSDCDGNGAADLCEILEAPGLDKNDDGVLDLCSYRIGDFDLDGIIGGSDLAYLLSIWGLVDLPIGDLTGDGIIDGADLADLLGRWGPVAF